MSEYHEGVGDGSAPEHIPHTCAGFVGAFVGLTGKQPTQQDVWDAAIRSWRDLNGVKSAEPVTWNATSEVLSYVSELMNDVHVVRPKDGYTPEQECELNVLRRIAQAHRG